MRKLLTVLVGFILCLNMAGSSAVSAESEEPAEPVSSEIEQGQNTDPETAGQEQEKESSDIVMEEDAEPVSQPDAPAENVIEISEEESELIPAEDSAVFPENTAGSEETETEDNQPENADSEETEQDSVEITEENEYVSAVLNDSYNFDVECPRWTLSRVNDSGFVSSDDYKDRVQLLVFYKAAMENDCAICASSRVAMESLTKCGWIADEQIKVIFVEANYSSSENTGRFISKYADDSADVEYVFNGSNFMFKLMDLTGYRISSFAAGVIIKDNKIVDMFDRVAYEEQFYDHIRKYADVKVPVNSVSIYPSLVYLNAGDTRELSAEIWPEHATNKKVTWTSSNPKIAAVDSKGKVTAKSAGTATITIKSADGGKTATCTVTVIGPAPTPTPTATPKPTAKPSPTKDPAACTTNGFCSYNGRDYWYENGVRQATPGDPKNLIDKTYHVERGREIFDPKTNAWYWLDSCFDGAKAAGKEVWMPYIYQDEDNWKNDTKRMNDTVQAINSYSEAGGPTSDMGEQVQKAIQRKLGKWVRYDENGKMLKGWVTITGDLAKAYPKQAGNTYFYDYQTGLMAKGWTKIGGEWHHFDEITGVMLQ